MPSPQVLFLIPQNSHSILTLTLKEKSDAPKIQSEFECERRVTSPK